MQHVQNRAKPARIQNDPAAAITTAERERLIEAAAALRREVGRRIVGQEAPLEEIVMAILAGGHALLVGVPGLAKTLMIRSIAEAMHLDFRRIQFTPDLVPSDITGTEIMDEDDAGRRSFRYVRGPAALLEAMQERHVTAAGKTMPLPRPFFVLATQNPIEQEGTYPLPEAQLDRFLFDVRVGYPSATEEVDILDNTTSVNEVELRPVLEGGDLLKLQQLVREVAASRPALEYASNLVRATRPGGEEATARVREYVRWGAGPRAGQALILGAKAHALLSGHLVVAPEDIRRVAIPVLRHRVLPNFVAEAEGLEIETILAELLKEVQPPASGIKA
jgi:MoxR-like ATPase